MKKYFVMILLSLASSVAQSSETVRVYWPFSASSPQAAMIRQLIDNANKNQEKYKFIFAHRPGAGGSVAAKTLIGDNQLSVMASTSSFYIRPLLYSDTSHDVRDFEVINVICSNQPIGLLSKNDKLLNSDQLITVGVIPGSVTNYVIDVLEKNNKNLKFNKIPYQSTPESTVALMGDHINSSVDFVGNTTLQTLPSSVRVVGITGTVDHDGHKTFKTLGYPGLENVVNDYLIFSNKKLSPEIQREFHEIFQNSVDSKVQESCTSAYGNTEKIKFNQLKSLHQNHTIRWNNIVNDK